MFRLILMILQTCYLIETISPKEIRLVLCDEYTVIVELTKQIINEQLYMEKGNYVCRKNSYLYIYRFS